MKKTITILLVLLVAAFAVFAADYSQKVELKSTIATLSDFQFQLGYGTTGSSYTYLGGDSTATGYTNDGEISIDASAGGTTYFNVKQGAELNLDTTQGTAIELDVTVTDWYLGNNSGSVSTETPNQYNDITMALTLSEDDADDNDNHNVVISGGDVSDNGNNSTATVTVTYTPGLTDANTDLFDFTATWVDKNLVAGAYTSTITLAYTAN